MTFKPIRLGMVGGGPGAFIGPVHRIASRLDGQFELVAGNFSSDPARGRAEGEALGLDPARVYDDFENMVAAESARADGIEAVAIVTPNHLHAAPAGRFLEAGIHVICDKPLAASLEEGRALAEVAARSKALFVLTHNYTGYPMIRQMRAMIAAGLLGEIRLVQVEYVQDWLAEPVETMGVAGAEWRTDPKRAGAGGAIGDIGTHVYNLASFVTQMRPASLLTDLTSFGPGRTLDDNAMILTRYANGAKGSIWASQVAVGNENRILLRVYGSKGGLEWSHDELNQLRYTPLKSPMQILTRGGAGAWPEAARVSRLPAGHAEGYLEGFATIYAEAARAIRVRQTGAATDSAVLYPTLQDGLDGLNFIDACVRSQGTQWIALP